MNDQSIPTRGGVWDPGDTSAHPAVARAAREWVGTRVWMVAALDHGPAALAALPAEGLQAQIEQLRGQLPHAVRAGLDATDPTLIQRAVVRAWAQANPETSGLFQALRSFGAQIDQQVTDTAGSGACDAVVPSAEWLDQVRAEPHPDRPFTEVMDDVYERILAVASASADSGDDQWCTREQLVRDELGGVDDLADATRELGWADYWYGYGPEQMQDVEAALRSDQQALGDLQTRIDPWLRDGSLPQDAAVVTELAERQVRLQNLALVLGERGPAALCEAVLGRGDLTASASETRTPSAEPVADSALPAPPRAPAEPAQPTGLARSMHQQQRDTTPRAESTQRPWRPSR